MFRTAQPARDADRMSKNLLTVRPRTLVRLVLVAGVAGCSLLAACGTIEGAGKDIQALGRGTSDAARSTGEAIDNAVNK
jgi:predicted small secreted protein